MPQASFFLKEPGADRPTPINLFFSYGVRTPMKYATGILVHPRDWNPKRQRVRESRDRPEAEQQNALLVKIEKTILSLYARQSESGTVTHRTLRESLDVALDRKKEKKHLPLLDYLPVIEKVKEGSSEAGIVRMAASRLREYAAETNTRPDYGDMTLEFRDRLVSFLEAKEYSQNTISTTFAALKIILTAAQEEGHNPYNHFRSRRFSARAEVVRNFALTDAELEAILNLDLSQDSQTVQNIRDTFLIGAYTGMRYGDYSQLNAAHIEEGYLYRKTGKTGAMVVVPVHWIVREILLRRQGQFPPPHSLPYMNKVVKQLAKRAGINSLVIRSRKVGQGRKDEIVEKWQLVSSHTARRSGATNMIKAGISRESVKMITGHKSDAAFNRYVDISAEENARLMADNPFFKKDSPADSE